jgi:glycosyltransferase involved in cell wall biosynthesis
MTNLQKTYWAYRNKLTNKLWKYCHMPATGKKKGDVLLSYFTEPFTITPKQGFSNFHTMYWECYEIARLFSIRGYDVDIINSKDHVFIPKKKYAACIEAEDDLERLMKYLPKDCKKVFHILIMHWTTYNKCEQDRLDALEKRRGIKLFPRRKVPPSRDAELADYLEGFGNKTIFKTFEQFGKKPFYIPISAVALYDFPVNKDWGNARSHYLWFGGGGAVLKGLDLALEAFAKMPDLHLHVCGPIYGEKDFVEEYKKELTETSNIHVYGRIDPAGEQFKKIMNTCSALIYPSGGEGSSGAVVQAMHAGLIPIITHETGIQEESGYIPLINPTPDSITKVTRKFSALPETEIKEKAESIWKYARAHYTREEFSRNYDRFISEILHL